MSQLRKDPIVGRWTIIATERARRPAAFVDPQTTATDPKNCPYCEDKSSPSLYEFEGVKVIESNSPILDQKKAFEHRSHGLYEVAHSYGNHEIVIESVAHIANMADLTTTEIKAVFETYASRMQVHGTNPSIEYILAYKNYGIAAGSRDIGHTRSQIMAVSVLPMRIHDKTNGAEKYFDYHERCLFCDIVAQELKKKERLIVENEHFVAITPFASRFPFEVWILPKIHHCDFSDGIKGQEDSLAAIMKDILLRFKMGLNDPAYNYMVQTAPVKNPSAFKDDYHWHIEVMPRLTRVAGFERGTGFYICPIPPEMTAAFLERLTSMPELRRDPVVGRWVVIDTDHTKGPADFPKEDNTPTRQAICPFCPGREHQTPAEVDAVRPPKSAVDTPGWLVRTVPNKFPVLISTGVFQKEGKGLYDQMTGIGAHEVVIESPDHEKGLTELTREEMKAVINQYTARFRKLSKDSRFKYIAIFKNFGASAGATIEHTHSQIIALPMVPKTVLEELKGAEDYRQSRGRCVFCDMIAQEYQDKERLVAENTSFLAFCPYAPRYAFEIWIIPKGHSADFALADEPTQGHLAQILQDVLKKIKQVLGNPSYNFYLHAAPLGYSQENCYHWHIEIIPKLTRSIGFEWGTGLHIVPTYPKDAARHLREAGS